MYKRQGLWTFVPDSDQRYNFNFGPDVYAGQTFSDVPGRRILMEWMVHIGYPFETGSITDPWNGAITLPYEIRLETREGEIKPVSYTHLDVYKRQSLLVAIISASLDNTSIIPPAALKR